MDEQTQETFGPPVVHLAVYGVLGFLVGLGVGYFIGVRSKTPQPPPPEELAKISQEISALRAKREARKVLSDDVIVPRRQDEEVAEAEIDIQVIAVEDSDWDYELEKQNRDSMTPYVIHKDEFWSNEMNFAQHTWTYYEGDDVMIDEEDVVVYNHDQKVGNLMWGHGSGHPNTVYIRNEKMRMEMEVLREEGLYSIEVMGLEVDRGEEKTVEHSNTKKNKRSKHDQ